MVPFITCAIPLCQDVCKLVLAVDVFDLDLGVKIDSIEQPIKSNSMSSGNMSHSWTSAFHNHLDHCFIVLKHIQYSFLTRGLVVSGNWINVFHLIDSLLRFVFTIHKLPVRSETCEIFPKTETIRFHNSRAGKPCSLSPVSREMISDSVELWKTDVCFLHIQLIGTNVWLPKTNNVPPEVDFESSRSPAKSESWNSPNLHCLAVCPTWQYCLYPHAWWMHEINRFKHLSQALVHFVIDLASFSLYQVVQYVPSMSILEQFESIHVTILQQISFLLLWSGGHRCRESTLCRVVESSCLPTHKYRSTHFFAWPSIS